jgi:Flagellar biogenesis protein
MSFGETLQLIAGILIVILAAYYVTYYIANKKNKRVPGRGISVRERFSLSKDKMVCVIEANGKSYLVVITNGGATLLDTVESARQEAAEAESAAAAPRGYEPNGLVARGIWKLFNGIRGATTAKTVSAAVPARSEERTFAEIIENTPEPLDDLLQGEEERTLRVAREEDAMDEIQRRLKNRRATAASADNEEAPDDE